MKTSHKFRLQKLLELKETIQKAKQRELWLAQHKLLKRQEDLQKLESSKDNFTKDMNQTENASVAQILRNFDYLVTLTENILEKKQEVHQHEVEVEQKRDNLLQIKKELKMLEKLKEKILERLQQENNNKEQKLIDELAIKKNRTI